MCLVALWWRGLKSTQARTGDGDLGTVKKEGQSHPLTNGTLQRLCGGEIVGRGEVHEPRVDIEHEALDRELRASPW